MIQILGLRDYFHHGQQRVKKKETFFENNWRANSVPEILQNYKDLVEKIPESERYNLYFTVSNCFEEPGRKLKEQWVIPFDIDKIDVEKAEEVARRAIGAIGCKWEQTGVVFSGNGVQFFVLTKTPIVETSYFEVARPHYRLVCDRINAELKAHGLAGEADPSVWSPARLMRMPGTLNKKPDKPERMAEVLQTNMEPIEFRIENASGLPVVAADEQLSPMYMAKFPEIDVAGVLSGCEFIKWSRDKQADVSEPQWYAALSLYAWMPEPLGREEAHKGSNKHPKYSFGETEAKLKQAKIASGPRTCQSINALWGRCAECPHYGKIKSPVKITTEEFIKTEKTGFHDIGVDQHGQPKLGKPNPHDMLKFFKKKYNYVTVASSREVYAHNGTHWEEMSHAHVLAFSDKHFKPAVTAHFRAEFLSRVLINNLRNADWFSESTYRKINFKNGVLDLPTMKFTEHSAEYGFRYVLDYDYNPDAQCPRFDRYLEEVLPGDPDSQKALLEFLGYAFSGDKYWLAKALFLIGEGANGKSTLIKLLKKLANKDSFSTVELSEIQDADKRYLLEGKLFNLAEETNQRALYDNTVFKNLTDGGSMTVKKLYSQPYSVINTAKFIFACNKLPISKDSTHAFYRRMVIIPFNVRFHEDDPKTDKFIDAKLHAELSGIFNRIIEAYHRLQAQGFITKALAVTDVIEEYRNEADETYKFWNEHFAPGDGCVDKQEAYDNFVNWCKFKQGIQNPCAQDIFWKRLKSTKPDLIEARPMVQGQRKRVIQGYVQLPEFDKDEGF